MTRCACGTVVTLLFLSLVTPAWSQQYFLYSPQPLGQEEKGKAGDGVLVREVPVQKGDTLYGISRKYSGHGSYYSQILLFNEIKNPNLIYTGDTLKVPVTKEQPAGEASAAPEQTKKAAVRQPKTTRKHRAKPAAKTGKQPVAALPATEPTAELSIDELKSLEGAKNKKKNARKKTPVAAVRKTATVEESQPVVTAKKGKQTAAVTTKSGQKIFEQAIKAYHKEDCRAALELFDRFLANNASSPQAADANPYKAECYLKLSSQ